MFSRYRKNKEEITSLACERDRCREDPTGWLLKILPNLRHYYNHSNIPSLAPILQASQHSFFTLWQGCYENWDIPSPPPTQPIGLGGVNKMAFLLRTLISQGISNLNHSYTLFFLWVQKYLTWFDFIDGESQACQSISLASALIISSKDKCHRLPPAAFPPASLTPTHPLHGNDYFEMQM